VILAEIGSLRDKAKIVFTQLAAPAGAAPANASPDTAPASTPAPATQQ
jgi:hypothetical protein